MDDEDFESLRACRARGMNHFAFLNGVLIWGLPVFVMTSLIFPMIERGGGSYWYLVLNVLVMFACFFLGGESILLILKKQYLKALVWGLFFFVAAFLFYVMNGDYYVAPSKSKVIIGSIDWGIGGYIYGIIQWDSAERRYKKEFSNYQKVIEWF